MGFIENRIRSNKEMRKKNIFGKIVVMLLASALILSLAGCGKATADVEVAESEPVEEVNHTKVEIKVKDQGTILVELYDEVAPITVENFVKLVSDGFYDGLTFHRIINGFMMQGGDPTGTGMGGLDETIKGEFAANNVKNTLSHTRGAISMARKGNDYNSASCQFFIVHKDCPQLDGSYAVFGYVLEGMDVVDSVCENTPVQDRNGSVLPEDQPIIESIRIVE